jgi:hypothetical protein
VADGAAAGFVRPHEFELAARGGFEVVIERVAAQGPVLQIDGRTAEGARVEVAIPRGDTPWVRSGEKIRVKARRAHVFSA